MWEWIQLYLSEEAILLKNIFYSVLFLVIIIILKLYTNRVIGKVGEDNMRHYKARKVCSRFYIFLYIVLFFMIWYESSSYLFTFLGLFSAGIAIATKEVIVNAIGGMYIALVKPFKVGDRIEIGGRVGDIIDKGLFQMTLLEVGGRVEGEQSTGRILHIPNMLLFSMPLANFEKGFKYIWDELEVRISMESDWQRAKELLEQVIGEYTANYIEDAREEMQTAANQYLICYNNLTPIVYVEIKSGAIILTVRYLCEPRRARTTQHLLWEKILLCLSAEEKIKLT